MNVSSLVIDDCKSHAVSHYAFNCTKSRFIVCLSESALEPDLFRRKPLLEFFLAFPCRPSTSGLLVLRRIQPAAEYLCEYLGRRLWSLRTFYTDRCPLVGCRQRPGAPRHTSVVSPHGTSLKPTSTEFARRGTDYMPVGTLY